MSILLCRFRLGGGMMERLTKHKFWNIVSEKQEKTGIHCSNFCNNCSRGTGDCKHLKAMVEKLAAYEDAEEQGLLLRLPCKVGSPLYRVYKKPTKCTAYGEYKDDYACQGCEKECDSSYVWAIYKYKADIKTIICLSDEIGKTVFLTQAEAEQKLKEMESD